MRSFALIFVVSLSMLLTPGCASTVPGSPPPASVAARAAASGLVAYREALAGGASRETALQAAADAAMTSALASVPGSVPAEYQPFIDAALLLLIAELDARKAGPEALPSDGRVSKALEDAIAEAEARRGVRVDFRGVK